MSASLRDLILAARVCPCDPTRGQSCRYCDGTDAEARDAAHTRRRPTRTSTAPTTPGASP